MGEKIGMLAVAVRFTCARKGIAQTKSAAADRYKEEKGGPKWT